MPVKSELSIGRLRDLLDAALQLHYSWKNLPHSNIGREALKFYQQFVVVILCLYHLTGYASQLPRRLDVHAVKHDLSLPLTDIQHSLNVPRNSLWIKNIENRLPFQTLIGLGQSLKGYTVKNEHSDIGASVGRRQYVQWVNSDIGVFDKSSGHLLPGFPMAGNKIWKGFGGPCEKNNHGTPMVKYDQLARRWVLSQMAYEDSYIGPFFQCVAVSTSENAAGSYYRYAFQFNSLNTFGKMGLWSDAYYFAFMMAGPSEHGSLACAIERSKMLIGMDARMKCRPLNLTIDDDIAVPVDLEGPNSPPEKMPGLLLNLHYFEINQLHGSFGIFDSGIYRFHVNFADSAKTYLTYELIPFISFMVSRGIGIAQPGGYYLDGGADLLARAIYRQFDDYGSLLFANNSAKLTGPNFYLTLKWHELRFKNDATTFQIFQGGEYFPDGSSRYLAAATMDKFGNVAMGNNISSERIYPSIELAYRSYKDPLNQLTGPQALLTGKGSQTGEGTWGRSSRLTIDPSDDCTFWLSSQYSTTTGSSNWSTAIIKFKFPECLPG